VVLPDVQIGRGARISRAIIDSRCAIPDGMVVGEDANTDSARFHRTHTGITLVTRDMLARLNG
jgi:glucose-1-phosphate adenylyltransferase